ncbi:hypothetical protein Tco_0628605 [Tanacetum coccineum]|uniref:Uncharacterized protein n=1 Tax=Tanacetum coccineum TaxID=301880 RepID=A0ABQ4WQW8_9ASTR
MGVPLKDSRALIEILYVPIMGVPSRNTGQLRLWDPAGDNPIVIRTCGGGDGGGVGDDGGDGLRLWLPDGEGKRRVEESEVDVDVLIGPTTIAQTAIFIGTRMMKGVGENEDGFSVRVGVAQEADS